MAQAKALDDRMHILVKQGRAPFVGSARGHEGIQVGATAALDGPDDWLVPHYRGLGNVVAMGLTAREWMLAVFAKADDPLTAGRNIPGGCFGYRARRVVTVSQVVASWLPKAAGMAYAAKLLGKDSVFLCNFGDGPVVYATAREAVLRARRGEGPTLIEARIRRINPHTSEDNQARYRTPEDIAEALEHDPVAKFEAWLAGRGWLAPEEAEGIRLEYERESSDAADWAEAQPDPRPEDALRHVFADSADTQPVTDQQEPAAEGQGTA